MHINNVHNEKQAVKEVALRAPKREEKVSGPKGPAILMATSVNLWHWLRAAYFSCLLHSARAATAPASLAGWHLVGGRGQMCLDRWRPTQGSYHSFSVPA